MLQILNRAATPPPPTQTTNPTPRRFLGRSALIVDDSEAHRTTIAAMLRRLSFADMHEAIDGVEGLAITRDVRPDVVICDLKMDHGNGFEFLRALRKDQDSALRRTPVVIASGLSGSGTVLKSVALDGSAFLAKPFRRDELADTLARVLGELN